MISSAAGQNWQELKLQYKVKQEGFVQVFVYNESGQVVFFDDLTIRNDPALIVQENHYDPWGLNLVGIESQGSPDHKFQYNGKEKQEEFGLHWNDGLTCCCLYWKRPFAGPDSCRVERQATFT